MWLLQTQVFQSGSTGTNGRLIGLDSTLLKEPVEIEAADTNGTTPVADTMKCKLPRFDQQIDERCADL